jgi:(p)ppGpp synthase/HD superfamily hydrolase
VKGLEGASQDWLERAIACALGAHAGQKYPSPEPEPYILHPLRVMCAVEGAHARMAAVLHDVVEDTEVTLVELQNAGYPSPVIHAVDCLTHRDGETWAAYIERVATDPMATIVKVADLRDNLRNNKSLSPRLDVVERIRRYEQALSFLEPRLNEPDAARPPSGLKEV